MTEQEWLACNDPQKMLEFLQGKICDRKLRLFGVACCRRVWDFLPHDVSRRAVDVAERYADLQASDSERQEAHDNADTVHSMVLDHVCVANQSEPEPEDWPSVPLLFGNAKIDGRAASCAAHEAFTILLPNPLPTDLGEMAAQTRAWLRADTTRRNREAEVQERAEQTRLVRDIFGPLPFRPVTISPAWQTANLVSLAEAICADRAFDRMPILADALEDAGCTNAEILVHCRGPGPHVRGCWVVDLLLGKE